MLISSNTKVSKTNLLKMFRVILVASVKDDGSLKQGLDFIKIRMTELVPLGDWQQGYRKSQESNQRKLSHLSSFISVALFSNFF